MYDFFAVIVYDSITNIKYELMVADYAKHTFAYPEKLVTVGFA